LNAFRFLAHNRHPEFEALKPSISPKHADMSTTPVETWVQHRRLPKFQTLGQIGRPVRSALATEYRREKCFTQVLMCKRLMPTAHPAYD